MTRMWIASCCLLCLLVFVVRAREPGVFLSYRADADADLVPDLDAEFWKPVPGVTIENSILGQPRPELRSEARSRWTDKNLYFLFVGKYDALHLKPDPVTTEETYKLWMWDVFELYLGANVDNINLYGEFQISPQGEYLDLGIDASKPKPGWSDERFWESGMRAASRIDDQKKVWYGTMRIPIASLDKRPPTVGNEMRVNVYRLHGSGEGRKRSFLAWQAVGMWNPHRPEKFGRLRLTGEP